ncbi:phage tail tape measure protein [Escherichia coli]|uniref:phage tail tape measure protein n=1 Tax=Escherichia coli TaxID=562 RepID=UPI000847B0DB|nr:phage tail tape measure protein [Escherichia coli]AOM45988.1 Phage tail length tape-measure protein 1 [Escherichia coli]
MATLRELIIKISANSQSFQSEIQRASRMGSEYYRTLQNGGRQAAAAAREQRRALAELNSQLTEIRGSAVGMAGAFAGAFATGHLISLADEWSSVNARLKQASQSSDEFSSSQKVLMDISQRTGTAFSDNAALFARSAASMREYGYSADDVLKVTEAISTGLKISGASTAEAGSVITQFSQALAQGVLRGEEFNSVNESGDRIVRALAAGMGVARKDLKAMADDGKLTADKVVPALISQLGVLRDEYAAMPETVSSSITKVENAFMAWVGGANEASGVTKTLSGVLNGVAGQIDNVATAVGALVAVGGARYFGNMASGAMSATAGLVTAARNEVALAEAQFRGTQIATARARAAVYRAQQAVAAARGTEMQKQELLRNAALIDQQKIREQLRSREETLKNDNVAARASNEAELLGYGQGERARERMRELQQIRDSFRQKDADLQSQYQTGDISEDFYRQARAQNAQYLSERLKDQAAFYAESDAQRADWQKGLQEGLSNWVDNASDYASQAAQLATEGISGMVNNITEMLNGNKVEWRNWASSVLQEISKVLMNAAIVNGIKTAANGMSGAGGFIGSIGDWLGGAVANAKGGVYTSANLSAYSNSIVDTPTYFAFAKGAGLMGEAGPEAIMPLTRAADGSLGVRAVGSMNGSAGLVYSPVYHIAIQNDGANGQIGAEAAGSLVQLIDQRVQAVMLSMRRDGGMLSG